MNLEYIDILWFILYFILVYITYIIVFGALIYKFFKPRADTENKQNNINEYFGEKECQDRVHLVEERFYANQVLINIITNAKETIDVSYFMINKGLTGKTFAALILEAADRGVKIRIIVDGILNKVVHPIKDFLYTYEFHPNIEIKYYEPFNLLTPWRWNNRLHDKFIIVDEYLTIMGGRNIDDKYLTKDGEKKMKFNDRDVLVVNTKDDVQGSVIKDIKKYYESIWSSNYSKKAIKSISKSKRTKAIKVKEYLEQYIYNIRNSNPELFELNVDWKINSRSAKKVKLIRNPLVRQKKEPWCWLEILNLMYASRRKILIENPFVIPTREMTHYLKEKKIKNIELLTNSLASNSHPYAHSAYIKYRKAMINYGVKIYEYQGPGIIHAKSFVIDERISLVGAYNLDSRSTFLSTESMLVIDSEDFANDLSKRIHNKIKLSIKLNNNGKNESVSIVRKRKVPIYTRLISIILFPIAFIFDDML